MVLLVLVTVLAGFFNNRKVLITGHTGFKGSWMSVLLDELWAKVYGYSLNPPTEPSLFDIAGINNLVHTEIGDICDYKRLIQFVQDVKPDIIIHMAAQPIVKIGYSDPHMTYETNVMGTVNILEAVRATDSVKSFLNVTTDKVYDNDDNHFIFKESDRLDGYDPYSNSKSCSELVTHSYKRSFFQDSNCAISTARAGNVIGGGDFAQFRIIPDCVEAALNGKTIMIRNPHSVRPFQHVLEPLFAYLTIVESQLKDPSLADSYNIGPDVEDCITAGELATLFCKFWGDGLIWEVHGDGGPHEAQYLRLDCTHVRERLGYCPHWHIDKAVKKTVEWSKVWASGGDVLDCMRKQIREYMAERFEIKEGRSKQLGFKGN